MNNINIIPVTPFNMNVITLIPTIKYLNPNDKKSKTPLIEYSITLFGLPIIAFSIYELCNSISKLLRNTFKYITSNFRFVIYEDDNSVKKAYIINPYNLKAIDYISSAKITRIDLQFLTNISVPGVSSFVYDYNTSIIKPILIKSGDE